MKATKWLALVLCAVLLFQSAPTADAVFDDVNDAQTALAVSTLAGLGVVSIADNYRPNDNLTRAEACKLLVCAMGLGDKVSAQAKKTLFSDVSAAAWYNGYINLAHAQGLVNGLGDGTFAPNASLSYGHLATMLLRMLGYTNADTGSVWPVDQIRYCESLGLSDGLGLSGGNVALTRAQAAVMIYRALREDRNGTLKPYYTAMNGVSSTARAILLDVNATTGATSGLVSAFLLEGDTGVTYYTQARKQSAALNGYAGTLLFNAAGRVTGFIPDSGDTRDIKLDSADAASVTASDGTSYRIVSGAKAIVGGSVYSYSGTGYLQLNNQSGKTVRLYYGDDGAITCLYLAGAMLGSSDAAVAETTPAASSLARKLGVSSTGYAITKNGAEAEASDLALGDVGYYDALSNTLRVSDYRVCGVISAASPNVTAAETITVAGCTFDVLDCAWDTLKGCKLGTKVTLLLTDDGKVAAVSPDTDTQMLGVLAANGKSITLLGSGVTLSGVSISYQNDALGSLVTVKASADELSCTAVKGGGAQKLDISARTLGSTPLAPSCAVFEWGGGSYVYSLEGVQGEASRDFDAIDWTTTLFASHVSYAHTNTAGEVDVLLLKHATNNCYSYGKLTIYSGVEGISMGSNTYNRAATVRNSSGTSSKYLCALQTSASYAGVTLGGSATDYKRVTEIRTLTCAATSSASIFEENDTWYAICGSAEYRISDNVEIYLDGTDSWLGGTDALVSLLSGDYTFTAYYDAAREEGGQIRVIVVS